MCRLSILMTAYNKSEVISESISSVLNSTIFDWELIILDDLSSDDTYQIAKRFSEKDARIKVFRNAKNLGDYPNRNKAASLAVGKYIKFLDADDMVYPYGLEYMIKYMESCPDADWGLTDINQDDNAIFPYMVNNLDIYRLHYFTVKNIFSKAPTSLIIKNDFFQLTGGFIDFKGVCDMEYFYRIALNSNLLLMPYGYNWCRGETKGSQSSIHYRNLALHVLYDEIEAFYLRKSNLVSEDFKRIIKRNQKRRFKNYVKLVLHGPKTISSYLLLKKQLMNQIELKLILQNFV